VTVADDATPTRSPASDPTENVKALTEAAVKRLDDLRDMESRHQEDLIKFTAENQAALANLRAEYGEKLRDAESKRIDAIRAVDIGAVNRAAEVSAAQAQTLAAQVATSAETLRTQVAAAATASTTALAAALDPIQKDIADLRRAQYEAQGQKTQVVESRSSSGAMVALIGLGVSILLALVVVLGVVVSRGAP
jgi:hypothetical protein